MNRIFGWLLIATCFLLLVMIVPGSATHWFRQGAGRTYAIQREAGVSHEEAARQGHTVGLIFSSCMVFGIPLPVFGLLSIVTAVLFGLYPDSFRALIGGLFVALSLGGWAFLGVAQHLLVPHESVFTSFVATGFIWLAIAFVFAVPLAIHYVIRRVRKNA